MALITSTRTVRGTGLLLALPVVVAACGGGDTTAPTQPEPADPEVARVEVTPSSAELHALEDTRDFEATVRDRAGDAMPGVSVSWSVSPDSAARVDGNGTVTAEANGTVTVEAAAEGVTGSARLTVDQEVASLDVSPDRAELAAKGDTVRFSAEPTDANGHPVDGAGLTWRSTDPEVVTVDSTGVATARERGQARVVAETAGIADSAVFSVDQEVASLEVSPDSTVVRRLGDTARYEADARDRNGFSVSASLRWAVTDSSVAAVDTAGRVTALDHGRSLVVARAGDVADSAVFVADTLTPAVTAVQPTPLEAGERAVIEGLNFGSDGGRVTVEIDGAEAELLSARENRLEVAVPTFDCRPRRDVEVSVSVAGNAAAPVAEELRPRGEAVDLAAGERRIVHDPTDFCLQFEETPSDAAYLVGFQSVTEVASTLTPVAVTVRGSGAGSTSSSVVEARPGAGTGVGLGREGQQRIREPTGRQPSHPTASLDLRADSETSASVGSDAAVGDIVDLTVPCLSGCDGPTPITAVITRIGDHVIWARDTANEFRYAEDEMRAATATFDNTVYPVERDYFGTPTDLDDNGRTVMVVSDVVRDQGFEGFVWSVDWCDGCEASDYGEYAYFASPRRSGRGPSLSLLTHEYAHVVQVSERIKNDAPHFSTRFNEGQAQIAEELVGHALSGKQPGRDYGWDTVVGDYTAFYWNYSELGSYFGGDERNLDEAAPQQCTWLVYADDSASGPCQLSLNYGVSWSLIRWMADHYGPGHPGGRKGFHRQMVSSSETGFQLVEQLTGTSVDSVLAGWAASLYLDGRPVEKPALWTNPSWNFYDVLDPHTTYDPLRAERRALGANTRNELEVRAASAAYFRLSGPAEPGAAVLARTPAGTSLPDQMQMWMVRIR